MTSVSEGSACAAGAFAEALEGARRVLLLGGYGCGNAGDEAILSVLLSEPGLAERDVSVVTKDPRASALTHRVDAIPAAPMQVARAIATSDAIVIGGGGIFSAYMGRSSMLLPALALASRAAGKRVLFRALGAYEGTPAPVAKMLVHAMQRSSFVSVRDDASAEALRGFGLRCRIIREPDPALRLCGEPYNGELPAGVRIGLALRRVRDAALQRELERSFVTMLRAIESAGSVPILLPFSQHPSAALEQDASYARQLVDRAGATSAVVVERLPPGELLTVIGSLDALVAMRFHAIVFGHVAGTPTLAIEYDDKCSAFVREHSIGSLPLREVNTPRLTAALERLSRLELAA